MNIPSPEIQSITGRIGIRTYPAGTLARVSTLIRLGERARAIEILMAAELECETKNLIMQGSNTGKDIIIQRLLGINTYSLNLAYAEIGTGTTAPTIADVALTTPVARAALVDGLAQDIGNNQAQIQYFFPDGSLTNSTYTEFGTFIDGSITPGTGQLFNHALFAAPYTKAPGTDITVQVAITLS